LQEAAQCHDEFKKDGAEILSLSTDTIFVHKAWHDNSPSNAKIAYPMVADPTARLCRYFGTYIEDAGLFLRGTFIIDPPRRSQSAGHPRQQHRHKRGRNSPQAPGTEFCAPASRQSLSGSWETGQESTRAGVGLGVERFEEQRDNPNWSKIMNDGYWEKKWEVTLSPEALIHVHYETASPEVINDGFKGLARELREVADQIEAIAPQTRQQT
jgi:peroxiredoxin (alkyl hydroperoxide reductase subunit C)